MSEVRLDALEQLGHDLLRAIGEDPDRDGLRDTPKRWARWWREFIEHDPGQPTAFDSLGNDEMIVVSGVRVWSLCEHHLLPFSCDISIGYVPNGRLLGLSKFGRIAHAAAHRLQVQERLVSDIADAISDATGSEDVAVVAVGEHLCMLMRGVRTQARMTTSVMRGTFRDSRAREEFLSLVGRAAPLS